MFYCYGWFCQFALVDSTMWLPGVLDLFLLISVHVDNSFFFLNFSPISLHVLKCIWAHIQSRIIIIIIIISIIVFYSPGHQFPQVTTPLVLYHKDPPDTRLLRAFRERAGGASGAGGYELCCYCLDTWGGFALLAKCH